MWRASGVSNTDTFVSWLPLYHDMGLIGACLGALVLGFHLVLMSPLAFLARPARWLETIHRHRGTVSAAPNFAYELCLSKLSDADLAGLDLSSWRLAFNGAEPVSPDTLERFAARFSPCGFKREALMPVYGLAESSVGLAFPPVGRGPWIDRVDRATLARDGVALCAVLAAPGLAWRRRAARALTRAAIGLIGFPPRGGGGGRSASRPAPPRAHARSGAAAWQKFALWHWFSCHLLFWHRYRVQCARGRIFLQCEHYCGRATGGWEVDHPPA